MTKVIELSKMTIIRNDEKIEVDIEGYIHFYIDYRYGENADYKYGESRMFIENVTDVVAYDPIDSKEIELTEEEIEKAKYILGQKVLEG
jgi:hypothetical protein